MSRLNGVKVNSLRANAAHRSRDPLGESYWSCPADNLFAALHSSNEGLTTAEAQQRLIVYGPNTIRQRRRSGPLGLLLTQFKSPLVLILIVAAVLSLFMGEWLDAEIMLLIVAFSAVLGFVQEYRAGNATDRLRQRLTLKSVVVRNGLSQSIPAEEVTPGDVALLSAGSLIPADSVVIEADDFFVNQAVLTGETFPVEKKPGLAPAAAGLSDRTNCVFKGTSVRSGSARVLVINTGKRTVFGQVSERLALRPTETEFERGIRQFSGMMTQLLALLVLIVFAVNVIMRGAAMESLLFAVALAVGMTPELLPAIIAITLSRGAQQMARRGVIVRRLAAIENLGSMDVLCTDKTGTLTLGVVSLDGALDPCGQPSEAVHRWAYLNAHFETGLTNPLDEAIVATPPPGISGWIKTEEIPYNFVRKRLSVAVQDTNSDGGPTYLVTKGALDNVLAVCNTVEEADHTVSPLDERRRAALQELFAGWSEQGYRVLGVAVRNVAPRPEYSESDEVDMCFAGFLLFFTRPSRMRGRPSRTLSNSGWS